MDLKHTFTRTRRYARRKLWLDGLELRLSGSNLRSMPNLSHATFNLNHPGFSVVQRKAFHDMRAVIDGPPVSRSPAVVVVVGIHF